MNSPAECFAADELRNFLHSALPDDRLDAIETHLAHCKSCTHAMHELAGDETWWSDIELALGANQSSATENHDSLPHRGLEDHAERLPSGGLLELLGPTDDPNMLGRIGAYEVVGLIGQGGMGVVFKAFDRGLNRYVAIKMLLPHLAASGAARERFRREGQAAAAVVNDHVLPIYVVDQWRGTPYLVMQYVRGLTLQQRLTASGPLPLGDVLSIGLHAARGLAAAHSQGLVHRDVKPSNILLDGGFGRALLTDFGLARAADDASLTHSGIIAGTPQFMSPEQIRGERLDSRSDLFGLGSVLYAMCTGHPPFRAETSYAVMRRITDEAPRPIREINPQIPDWLVTLIDRLMAKQAADRPRSATVVADWLQQGLAHLEQPDSVSLPDELKTPRPNYSQRKFRSILMLLSVPTIVAVLVGISLQLVVMEPPSTQENATASSTVSKETKVASDVKSHAPIKLNGSTNVSGYTISLQGAGRLGDISERVVRFRPPTNAPLAGQVTSRGDNQSSASSQTFDHGNGTGGAVGGFGAAATGSGGGGFASASGATFGSTFAKPTYGIALKITPPPAKRKRNTGSFAELGSAVKVVEADGTIEEVADSGPITTSWPSFDAHFPGSSGLYLPRRKGLDVLPKEIHGELKITPGRRVEAVFSGANPQLLKVEGEMFAIKSITEAPNGLNVVALFPPTTVMKSSRNLMERMHSMMTSLSCYELEIRDENGNVHVPSGASIAGNGGGSSQAFRFNGTVQEQTTQATEPDMTTLGFRFNTISLQAINSIHARVVERNGEPERIPFVIEVKE